MTVAAHDGVAYFGVFGNTYVQPFGARLWALVAKGRNGDWELYNIADDRSELDDLAGKHPERAEAMAAMWQAYAERSLVLPYPAEQKEKTRRKTPARK